MAEMDGFLKRVFVMDSNHKVYCDNCEEKTDYILESSDREILIKGVSFSFLETKAYCKQCGKLIYVPGVHDSNVYNRKISYCKEVLKNGLQ